MLGFAAKALPFAAGRLQHSGAISYRPHYSLNCVHGEV
jgi:hypothetical protein